MLVGSSSSSSSGSDSSSSSGSDSSSSDGSSSSSSDSSSDSEEDEPASRRHRTNRAASEHRNVSRHHADQPYQLEQGRRTQHASRSSLEEHRDRDHQNGYSRHDDYDRRSHDREHSRSNRDREYSRRSHGREEPVAHTSTRRIASKISVPSNYRSQVQEGGE